MIDLDELERKARAATKGPWVVDSLGHPWRRYVRRVDARVVCGIEGKSEQHDPDATYIAAASPDRVPALIAEVRRLRRALRELTATVRGECPSLLNEDSGGDGPLAVEIDALLGGDA